MEKSSGLSSELSIADASGISIQRYLDENAAMLNEWEKLLTSAGARLPANAQKHALYRKKLHENLTLLAKLADQQRNATKAAVPTPAPAPQQASPAQHRSVVRQPPQPAPQPPSQSTAPLSSLHRASSLGAPATAAAATAAPAGRLDLAALQALQLNLGGAPSQAAALNVQALRILQSQNQALVGLSTLPPHIAAAVHAKMQSMQQQQQQQQLPTTAAAPAPSMPTGPAGAAPMMQSPPQQQPQHKGVKRPLS